MDLVCSKDCLSKPAEARIELPYTAQSNKDTTG